MTKPILEIQNASKSFLIPHEKHSTLKQYALSHFSSKDCTKLEAVKNVSFKINQGEFFGIIGPNGSGKSTLLKMIAKIYEPSGGKISVHGNISPFIELGVGFNPELTARDNIFLNGSLLGLTKSEIQEKFDEIIGFAELENFVDQRLKNFSSGMQVRLGFSLAIKAYSEILLLDEVLAVGDANFQQKCLDVFARLKKEGKTIIFVSHSMGLIQQFCDRVALMVGGKLYKIGKTDEVVYEYDKLNADNFDNKSKIVAAAKEKSEEASSEQKEFGKREVKIESVETFGDDKKKQSIFASGDNITIRINYKVNNPKIVEANFGIGVHKDETPSKIYCFGIDTQIDKIKKISLKDRGYVDLLLEDVNLLDGRYSLNAVAFREQIGQPLHFIVEKASFTIVNKGKMNRFRGIVNINHRWKSNGR